MKWYAACSRVSSAIGGRTPNASAVRNTTLRGPGPMPVGSALPMKSSGYAARVFSVNRSESRSSSRVSGYMSVFSRIVPKRFVVAKMSGSYAADRRIVLA